MTILYGAPGYAVEQNSSQQILQIRVWENTPVPRTLVAASALTLRLTEVGTGTVLWSDSITAPTNPPTTPRITNPSTGIYQFRLGDPTGFPLTPGGLPNQETVQRRTILATWYGVGTVGSEPFTKRQVIEVVGPTALMYVELFRQFLDKNVKRVDLEGPAPIRLGYTDFQLITYLFAGLSAINAYPPYPTVSALDDWPTDFQWMLYKAGLVTGLTAQSLYAVDTDIPNWSDQGNAFVIEHFPKLAQLLNAWSQELAAEVPKMKFQHFVGGPSGKVEAGPNARLNALIQASPNGALFRNLIFR